MLSLSLVGACHKIQPPCENRLYEDFSTFEHVQLSNSRGSTNLAPVRADVKASLTDCEITGIGEPYFYPYPLTKLDFAILADDQTLTKSIASNHDIAQGYYATRSKLAETPLHFAANYGNPPAIEALLSSGFDVNTPDNIGTTPLMAAVGELNGSTENMEVLLRHGANIDARTHLGVTALMMAIMEENADCIPR
jgi:hypothetical protein